MLWKRTRSRQKDHRIRFETASDFFHHSDILDQQHKNNSFPVPVLFVGFQPIIPETISVRTPTSPLDFRIFSSFGNPFRCLISQNEGHLRSWEDERVGLSLIESLDNETKQSGKIIRSSDRKTIPFGPQMSIRNPKCCTLVNSVEAPQSLPETFTFLHNNTLAKQSNVHEGKSDVLFQIGVASFELESNFRSCSLDSGSSKSKLTNFGNSKSSLGSGGSVSSESELRRAKLKLRNSSGKRLIVTTPSIHPGTDLTVTIPTSEMELSEDYTCVRTHGPNAKVTHIFGDHILECHEDKTANFIKKSEDEDATTETAGTTYVLTSYPSNDFLKFCFTCEKELEGEDIYIYRGEKAFCSYACRSQVIDIDEVMEKSYNNFTESSDNPSSCFSPQAAVRDLHYLVHSAHD